MKNIKNETCDFLKIYKKELVLFSVFLLSIMFIEIIKYQSLYIEYPDAGLYISFGENLINGYGYFGREVSPQMVVPPGMPMYLYLIQLVFHSITPAIILQYIMHALSALLIYKISFRISSEKYISIIASIMFLFCEDIYLYSPLSLLTETPTLFLFLLVLYLLQSKLSLRKLYLISFLITICGLIRPHFFILFIPLVFQIVVFTKKSKIIVLIKCLVIPFSFLIINMSFNYINTGNAVLLANYTAKPFYLANNPNTKNDIEYSSSASNNYAEDFFKDLDIDNPEIVDYNEKQNLLKTKAVDYIIQNPIQTIKNMTNKFLNMFIKPYKNLVMLSLIGLILMLFNKEALKKNLFLLSSLLFTYFTYAIITSSGLFVQRYAIYALPIYFILSCSGIGSMVSQIKSRLT